MDLLVSIVLWVILGGVAGWVASRIMKSSLSLVGNIIVGVIGAVIGGFLFNLVGLPGDTGFNLWTLLVAIVGAVVLLYVVRLLRRA